jgi:SsrA-binding protein
MAKDEDIQAISTNRKAGRDYHLDDRLEAGIVLTGTEIKSLRARGATLNDAFARVVGTEIFLYNCHISPHEQGNRFNHDPVRIRKLLLHRAQIERLMGLTARKGWSIIPLRIYLKHGMAKVEIAIAQGKRHFEKRDKIRKRESDRQLQRVVRHKR